MMHLLNFLIFINILLYLSFEQVFIEARVVVFIIGIKVSSQYTFVISEKCYQNTVKEVERWFENCREVYQ